MKAPDSHYERFTPTERIALVFEAMGRRDYTEANRLIGTCPEKHYRMPDAAYSKGVRTIHDCCMHVLLLIEEAGGKAMACLGVMAVAQESKKKGNRKLHAEAAEAYRRALGTIFGYWEAWREFCAEVSVDPAGVVRASWGDIPRCIADPQLPIIQKLIEADPEAKAKTLELFREKWKVHRDRCC